MKTLYASYHEAFQAMLQLQDKIKGSKWEIRSINEKYEKFFLQPVA